MGATFGWGNDAAGEGSVTGSKISAVTIGKGSIGEGDAPEPNAIQSLTIGTVKVNGSTLTPSNVILNPRGDVRVRVI